MSNVEEIKSAEMKIFSYVIGDILKTIKGGALMGAFIQTFCLIDYLAAIARLANNNQNAANYKEFIEKYLRGYDPEKLYAIRCGLVHTYGQSERMKKAKLDGYIFQHKNPENHKKYMDNVYRLNLSNFVFDIIKATFQFFSELKQKQESELYEYKERAKNIISIFGPLGISYSLNYGNIDSILSCMDSLDVDWKILENEIYKLCLTK
jgi:hypothetical protein